MNKKTRSKWIALIICAMLLLTGCQQDTVEWDVVETQDDKGMMEELSVEFETQESAAQSLDLSSELSPEMLSQEVQGTTIYVYICGEIANPGVYQVAEHTRLFEVVELAGGMTAQADQTYVNLAREVADGEQIVILSRQETKKLQAQSGYVTVTERVISNQTNVAKTSKININTASCEELMQITGIGESRAQAIIAYRQENGRFSTIEGIMQVAGIKDGLFQKIKEQITV